MKRYKVEIVCNGYTCFTSDSRLDAITVAKEAKKQDIRAIVWDYEANKIIYRNWIPSTKTN
jgi:hypothetical protein